jgi:hypothetical protein
MRPKSPVRPLPSSAGGSGRNDRSRGAAAAAKTTWGMASGELATLIRRDDSVDTSPRYNAVKCPRRSTSTRGGAPSAAGASRGPSGPGGRNTSREPKTGPLSSGDTADTWRNGEAPIDAGRSTGPATESHPMASSPRRTLVAVSDRGAGEGLTEVQGSPAEHVARAPSTSSSFISNGARTPTRLCRMGAGIASGSPAAFTVAARSPADAVG